jgi:hypothetical protein
VFAHRPGRLDRSGQRDHINVQLQPATEQEPLVVNNFLNAPKSPDQRRQLVKDLYQRAELKGCLTVGGVTAGVHALGKAVRRMALRYLAR